MSKTKDVVYRCSPEVIEVLRNASVDGEHLILNGKLDKKQYAEVNKAIELLGGKWSKKHQAHVFPTMARAAIAPALANGVVFDEQKTYQVYPTPQAMAERMVQMAGVVAGLSVLEPSAGDGAIAAEIASAGDDPCCVEIRKTAAARLRERGWKCLAMDFLELNGQLVQDNFGTDGFDRVVMNPPFKNGQDIAHVIKAFGFLRPGGVLVAIVSSGFTYRADKAHRAFSDFVEKHKLTAEQLPSGTFEDAAATAILIVLAKPEDGDA